MTIDEKKKILKNEAEEIYNDYFISGEVWVFRQLHGDKWFEKYDAFKKFISKNLGVHYNDIGIAGSAKLGFSLDPEKELKDFDSESDVDIIIVSRTLFERFWQEYLNDSYNPTTRINNIGKISFGVFRRYIFLDGFRNNEFYNQWCRKTMGFENKIQLFFDISNDIHYRIFESWDAVKSYYMSSIRASQIHLEGNNASN